MPTVDGLCDMAVDVLAEDLGALTLDDARFLLEREWTLLYASGLSAEDVLPGPSNELLVRALVGGMPTREDAEYGARDPRVRELLERAQIRLLELSSFDLLPDARSVRWDRARENARADYTATALALMEELDEVTTYKNWALLWRLRMEMER